VAEVAQLDGVLWIIVNAFQRGRMHKHDSEVTDDCGQLFRDCNPPTVQCLERDPLSLLLRLHIRAVLLKAFREPMA
jgi:hypothetical protein